MNTLIFLLLASMLAAFAATGMLWVAFWAFGIFERPRMLSELREFLRGPTRVDFTEFDHVIDSFARRSFASDPKVTERVRLLVHLTPTEVDHAIASLMMTPWLKEAVQFSRLYALVEPAESSTLEVPPKVFVPKEWSPLAIAPASGQSRSVRFSATIQ